MLRRVALVATVLAGCGPSVGGSGEASGSRDTGTSSNSSNGPAATTFGSDVSTGTSGMAGEDSSSGAGSSSTGVPLPGSCSTYAQDCPPGYKCNPYSNDGNLALDDARCVEVVERPDAVGEPCTWTDGSSSGGLDSCERGAVCWTSVWGSDGSCVALCSGDEAAPTCAVDGPCFAFEERADDVCLPWCDPFRGTCAGGVSCRPTIAGFVCTPGVVPEAAGTGTPCRTVLSCSPGLVCAEPVIGWCDPNAGPCCQPPCDLDAPACPDGAVCTPWPDPLGPGQSHVGVCVDAA
ncbi:MAG: hypothetical protein AAGA54_12515 [Myxococcota bacterium]